MNRTAAAACSAVTLVVVALVGAGLRPARAGQSPASTAPAAAPVPAAPATGVARHELAVRIDADKGTLEGTALLDLDPSPARGSLDLRLGQGYRLLSVTADGAGGPLEVAPSRAAARPGPGGEAQVFTVRLPREGAARLRVTWAGTPPALPEETRFTRDEVVDLPGGYLSPKGCFLGGDAGWYPSADQAVSRFVLAADVPAAWRVVSEGRLVASDAPRDGRRVERYDGVNPLEGIDLVAAPWTVTEADRGGTRVAVYTLPGTEPELAGTYLTATAGYLERFTREIGPHAWPQFVVAEHILPTGYGMPSFTLLGSAVMRLPFIVKTSLGHEVLHDWWGNGVYVDRTRGNWCEGLTAYMADHAFAGEAVPGGDVAYRRQILRDYLEYAAHGDEQPVAAFRERHSRADRALGYGKVAMIFHMLRRELGDDGFVAALRAFYAENKFRRVSWDAVEAAFTRVARRDLRAFFAQWVERPGAPQVRFAEATAPARVRDDELRGEARLAVTPGWSVVVPADVRGIGDASFRARGTGLPDAEGRVILPFRIPYRGAGTPAGGTVELDPDVDLFRRLDPREVPATLARVLAGPADLVVLGTGRPEALQAAARNLAGTAVKASGPARVDREVTAGQLAAASRVVVLGLPAEGTPSAAALAAALPAGAEVHDDAFRAGGKSAAGTGAAACLVLEHGTDGRGALAFLDALSPGALLSLGRRVQHYGKYSWLLFEGDRPVLRETAPPPFEPSVPVEVIVEVSR